jgi:hypothetical protein
VRRAGGGLEWTRWDLAHRHWSFPLKAHGEVLAQLSGPGAPVPIGVDDCVPRAAVNGVRSGTARASVTPAKRRLEEEPTQAARRA